MTQVPCVLRGTGGCAVSRATGALDAQHVEMQEEARGNQCQRAADDHGPRPVRPCEHTARLLAGALGQGSQRVFEVVELAAGGEAGTCPVPPRGAFGGAASEAGESPLSSPAV